MKGLRKKWISYALVGSLLSVGLTGTTAEAKSSNSNNQKAKNVIMLIMDGSSDNVSTISRWYKGEDLALDSILTGAVRTYSAESAITDSAPAATALGTGNKSNSGYVGVLPSLVNTPGVAPVAKEDAFRPVANVLEGAKLAGKSTGIIATSEIQHATPAGFSAHVASRSNYDDIGEQQVYQNIDVVLGGGYSSLKETRKDGENLLTTLEEKGYDFVTDREQLLSTESNKIWGSFAPSSLAYDVDRQITKPNEPTLAEMTDKAIQTLSKDKDGFFLMVEGSKIDWAAHANDPIGMITDFLAFDDAVAEALEFAKKNPNTLVIAVTDHGNSGITMGNQNTNSTYDKTPVSAYIEPLKKAKMTVEGALSLLKEDQSNLLEVAALYGLTNPSAEEITMLKESKNLAATLVQLLSQRANIGFTTGGHTGDDVFLYSYGPSNPTGLVENTDLANTMAQAMNFDLNKLTSNLFVNAQESFKKLGYETSIDKSDETNPIFVAENKNQIVKIPENKNIVYVENKQSGKINTLEFKSVAVYNDQQFFISQDMLKAVR